MYLEVSLGSLAAVQAQESFLPLKEQLSEVQDQVSRVLDWQSLFDDCVGDPDNICQSDFLVRAIFNVLSVDLGFATCLPQKTSAYGEQGCGRCTRWQTAGGPGRYTNTGHGMGR